MQNKGKITTSFLLTFGIFTIVILLITGIVTYFSQMSIYREQYQQNAYNICEYLKSLMEIDLEDTLNYQNYFMEHYDEMDVPLDFTECKSFEEKYQRLFAKYYPDKTLGVDIEITECNDEVQNAYFTYRHAYWVLEFEKATEDFGLLYTYYVVPPGEPLYMTFVIDGLREERESGDGCIALGVTVEQEISAHTKMWEAYNSGTNPDGYDNEYGKTYGYYSPLLVDGKVIGVIGAEVEIADYNHAIMLNAIQQVLGIAVVLIFGMFLLVFFIKNRYIARIVRLEQNVEAYSETKDVEISKDIEENSKGNDEISRLAERFSIMILDLDEYMKSLVRTAEELSATREHVNTMSELAHKDALTGIRNRLAYDNETKVLEWDISSGTAEFGIAIIDLNFLKRINDTFGHEQGNIAIKNLCALTCKTFAHSPVFRIGGDEFAVILRGSDYQNIDTLVAQFNEVIEQNLADKESKPWMAFSAAIGYSLYDASKDTAVENIFKRAKTQMKAVRTE